MTLAQSPELPSNPRKHPPALRSTPAHADGARPNGAHPNGAHTNGGHTNGGHPNGVRPNGVHSNVVHPIGSGLIAGLPQAELDVLWPHLTRVRLVSRQVLLESGRAPEHAFFIEEGLASLVAETRHGQAGVQVAMIGREGMIGSLSLLDGSSAAYSSAVMQIPGRGLRISAARLRQCLEECPALREACFGFIQLLAREIMNIAACNARNTLTERCVTWLLMADERMGGGDLTVTHEALATMLGLRRSGVTVATAALHKAGLIRANRGRIRILDRPGMEAIAKGGARVAPDGDLTLPDPVQEAAQAANGRQF